MSGGGGCGCMLACLSWVGSCVCMAADTHQPNQPTSPHSRPARVLAEFKSGKHPLMLATDVAARGLGTVE